MQIKAITFLIKVKISNENDEFMKKSKILQSKLVIISHPQTRIKLLWKGRGKKMHKGENVISFFIKYYLSISLNMSCI